MRVGVGRIELLERVADPTVELHTPRRTEVFVQGVSDQDVCEAHPAWLRRKVCDDALSGGFVEDLEELFAAHVTHLFERGKVELASEYGGEKEHEPTVVRDVPKPASDHLADTLGYFPIPALLFSERLERDFRRQQTHELADE